jgi:hypothetical protein
MKRKDPPFEEMLETLDKTVAEAVDFFNQVDENLADGYQTTRDVVSHLVYWHGHYIDVLKAVREGRQPELKSGTFKELNAEASKMYSHLSLKELASRLTELQVELKKELRAVPDPNMEFPNKEGGRFWSVSARVLAIESHIRNHIKRMRRAALVVVGRAY